MYRKIKIEKESTSHPGCITTVARFWIIMEKVDVFRYQREGDIDFLRNFYCEREGETIFQRFFIFIIIMCI